MGSPISRLCAEVVSSLSKFTKLRTLELFADNRSSVCQEIEADYPLIHTAISANSNTLSRLSIRGEPIWGCQSLWLLQELELIMSNDVGDFSSILHHCASLRNLSIVYYDHAIQPPTMLVLPPTALPELISFKLFVRHDKEIRRSHCTIPIAEMIAKFLEEKKKLRRLDVYRRAYDEPVDPLLAVLPTLPALEVLGLDIPSTFFNSPLSLHPRTDMRILDQQIPEKVSALMIRGPYTIQGTVEDLTSQEQQQWVNLVRVTMYMT